MTAISDASATTAGNYPVGRERKHLRGRRERTTEVRSWRAAIILGVSGSPHAYGALLLLILASLAFQLAAPDQEWARLTIALVQAATVVLALRVSRIHRSLARAGTVAAVLLVVGAAIALTGSDELHRSVSVVGALLLVLLALPALAVGLVQSLRATREVSVNTMFGVLSIYLLLGMGFAFAFSFIDSVASRPFFGAWVSNANPADFLYFSFATMTTVGYGDLTAATDLGRSVAIMEALLGQIYMVTVVALIVGNLGRARRRTSSG